MGKQLGPHFNEDEFRCPHCGEAHMKDEFIAKLEVLRYLIGKPMVVTSGWRCPTYNATLSNASPTSSHLKGWAADFKVEGDDFRMLFLENAFKVFPRIGIGVNFVHLDIDPIKPSACWLYGAE